MGKQPKRKTNVIKRSGQALWISDEDVELLRSLADAEDRTLKAIVHRALQLYAKTSKAPRGTD